MLTKQHFPKLLYYFLQLYFNIATLESTLYQTLRWFYCTEVGYFGGDFTVVQKSNDVLGHNEDFVSLFKIFSFFIVIRV